MPSDAADVATVVAVLRVARRRLGTQAFLERLARGALATGGTLVVLMTGWWLASGRLPPPVVWAGTLAAFGAGVCALTRWPTAAAAARLVDRRADTRERFTTALALAGRTNSLSAVETLARDECARFAEKFPVRRWTPFSLPRAARWLPVPLITTGMIAWHVVLRHDADAAGTDPALQAALHAQADDLKKAADTAAGKPDDTAANRRLAEELARAAERLRQIAAANTADADAARRDALRELSDLQSRLRRLAAETAADPSPAELAALAAALQRQDSEAARAAAEALRKGDATEAARQLERLLEELKKGANPAAALERLARAMQDQAGKLSAQERGELARQMAQAQAEAQQREELLRKIADLLRRRGGGAASANRGGSGGRGSQAGEDANGHPSAGRTLTNRQLQALLRSLENMKNGLNGNDGNGGPGGLSLALEDGPDGGVQTSKPGGAGENGSPGGAPGGERDRGTTEIGTRRVAEAPAPAENVARAPGMLGEGETLSDFAPSNNPGAPARAGRRYRELYETMVPAARDSVRQENIPLGSRVLVERYFQNIRPPD